MVFYWDHPRVCGEHTVHLAKVGMMAGSSPRMRGTRRVHSRPHGADGIIPAYAGNTSPCRTNARNPWDHPRVCGEHPAAMQAIGEVWGSSPRMRGTLWVL